MTNEVDPKSPIGSFELPRGYLLEKEDGTFAILPYVQLKEMTGVEEDMLLSSNKMSDVMKDIARNCIIRFYDDHGNEVEDMSRFDHKILMCDFYTILLRLRQVTLGSEFIACFDCEACGNKNYIPWDLSVQKIVKSQFTGDKQTIELETSRGNKVEWRPLHASSETDINKKRMFTGLLMNRVFLLNEGRATEDSLRNLSFVERKEIREQFKSEGNIDFSMESECKKCGADVSNTLSVYDVNFWGLGG